MNHDATHCDDYKVSKCPKKCYRAQLTQDLRERQHDLCYANMRITDVNRLNYVDFLILRREAFIYKLSLTKKGRELLLGAYCAEQTEPDRASLRAYFGGEKRGKE